MDYKLEDLLYKGLQIYQSQNLYKFNSDSVRLVDAVSAGRSDVVCDLGTGSGIMAILLAARCGCKVLGVELQKELADMAAASVEFNDMTDKVRIVCGRMQDTAVLLDELGRFCVKKQRFDIVISNPPYGKPQDGLGISNKSQLVARTEVEVTLKEVVRSADELLKFGGKLYMIVPSRRMAELIKHMCACLIEPKQVILLGEKDKKPTRVIVIGRKGASEGLVIEEIK